MEKFISFLYVGIGGAAGSMLRYGVSLLIAALNLPANLATLIVNVGGSFCIGCLSAMIKGENMLLLLTVGLCGGFTTFSTFSLQCVRMIQEGKLFDAALYIIGTLALCIIFTAIGYCICK